MHRAEPSAVQGILEGLTGFYRSRSTRPHRAFRRMSRPVSDRQPRPTRRWSLDPDRPVTNGGSREVQSGLLLRHRLARFMDLLPVGCELQRLVVLRERFLPAAPLRQQVGPPLERISAPQPVRVAPTHARKRTQSSLSAAAIILASLDYEEINWGGALTHRHLERGSLLVQPISQGRKKLELANRCVYQ